MSASASGVVGEIKVRGTENKGLEYPHTTLVFLLPRSAAGISFGKLYRRATARGRLVDSHNNTDVIEFSLF